MVEKTMTLRSNYKQVYFLFVNFPFLMCFAYIWACWTFVIANIFSKQIFQLISSVFSGLASLWSQPRKNKEINQLEGENNWYPLNVERGKILRYQRAKSKNKQHNCQRKATKR